MDSTEIEALRLRLQEAEELLEAIRTGSVDAVMVSAGESEQIYSLRGAEHAYRIMIEAMKEGAIITDPEGVIQYCNRSFTEMIEVPSPRCLPRSSIANSPAKTSAAGKCCCTPRSRRACWCLSPRRDSR